MTASKKYRIAMVAACPYPVPQGSQVLIHDTAACLRDVGHDVHLVVYGYGIGETSDIPIVRSPRIPGMRKTAAGPSLLKPFADAALARTLRRTIREHQIDIVHAHNYEGLLVALAAGHRPIVYHAHNVMFDELPYFLPWRKAAQSLGSWLDGKFPPKADAVLALHHGQREHLVLLGCDRGRVHIVGPPCYAEKFPEPEPVRPDVIPPVVYAGNLDSYQNLGLLEAAMAMVRNRIPEARLIIASGQRYNRPGAEQADVRTIEDLTRVLAQDCVVACPRTSWSGYPIKILNAMAAGRTVVACNKPSWVAGIQPEINGLRVPFDDPETFAIFLAYILERPALREKLGQNARAWVREYHNPALIARLIESVYAGL